MAVPLTPLTPLTATPVAVAPPAPVTFQISLRDTSAPPAGNSRELTLSINSGNNIFFAGKTKSKKHPRTILPTRTDVSITETLIEDPPGGAPAGVNLSMFDDTGRRLGSVVVGIL